MKRTDTARGRALLVSLAVVLATALPARAATLVGLTTSGKLVGFDSAAPGTLLSSASVTGLASGDTLLAIDYRPATGQLYGVTAGGRLVTLNAATGVATAVGSGFTPAPGSVELGFDFNPAVDRIRLVTFGGVNLRLHPDTGALAATDTPLAYASADPNTGRTPSVAGSAYTNSYAGTSGTTLYSIDAAGDVLVTQGGIGQNPSPNGGLLFTVGALGVDTTGLVGFDISPTGLAFASLTAASATSSTLHAVSLASGRATSLGTIGGGEPLRDLALVLASGSANVLLVPSAAHASGFGGAFYTTDLTITNTASTEVAFTLRFLGHDVDGRSGAERSMGLQAGRSVTISDVLGSQFGVTSGFGAIRVLADAPGLVVSSQTSTASGAGTFGQSVPAFRPADLGRQGSPQVIGGIQQTDGFRSNLVLVNALEAALDVEVSLVSDQGQMLATRSFSLPPLGMTQVTGVAPSLGVSGPLANARVTVSTPTANGAFAAYAALIDNGTSDPRTLLPREAAKPPFSPALSADRAPEGAPADGEDLD